MTRTRADALRNRQAVLDGALHLFRTDPAATVAQVATAAGVGRVTLYGHFATRDDLVEAALAEAMSRVARAVAALDLGDDPAAALDRLVAGSWQLLADGYGAVEAACRVLPAARVGAHHDAVLDTLRAVLDRGRAAGAFRTDLPRDWLVACVSALVHEAGARVALGEVGTSDAGRYLSASVAALVAPR
ncbi:MAG TPA: TetR family transcriptional regulator [Cellulomonas sp.]